MEDSNKSNDETKRAFPFDVVEREWPVIKDAPYSAGAIFLLGCVLTYLLFSLYIVPGKDATIESLKTQLGQAQKIEAADQDAWPALTDSQLGEWTSILEPYGIKTLVVGFDDRVNARGLYRSIEKLGKNLQCRVLFAAVGPQMGNCQFEIQANRANCAIMVQLFSRIGTTKGDPNFFPDGNAAVNILIGEKSAP